MQPTALLSKAFVAIDLYLFSQTHGCRQQHFQAARAGRAQAARYLLYAIPQAVPSCTPLLLQQHMVSWRGGLTAGDP